MKTLWKIAILPSLLGAWVGASSSFAHADCACNLTARLLTPDEVPVQVCLDEDVDCEDGFLAEGRLLVVGEEILLDVYIGEDDYPLELVQ
jgi:hypothetical protein